MHKTLSWFVGDGILFCVNVAVQFNIKKNVFQIRLSRLVGFFEVFGVHFFSRLFFSRLFSRFFFFLFSTFFLCVSLLNKCLYLSQTKAPLVYKRVGCSFVHFSVTSFISFSRVQQPVPLKRTQNIHTTWPSFTRILHIILDKFRRFSICPYKSPSITKLHII